MAENTKTVLVGVFEDRNNAVHAVRDLEAAGFKDDQIGFAIRGSDAVQGGMITDAAGAKDAKGAVTGAITGGALGGVLAAVVTALIPGVGPVLAAGSLAMFFGYAAAGTAIGGILGAMTGLGISEEEAVFYEKHFSEGKAIVAVKASTRSAEAADILRRHGGFDLHNRQASPVQTGGAFSQP
jgi:hypothetical protein